MNYKIYKTDDNDLNPSSFMGGEQDYTASLPKTGADMNGGDANKAYHTYHLSVPTGGDPRHYEPEKLQSAEYGGVEYKADNEGQGQIDIFFDGVDDIDTVVAAWDAANVGNEVSHDGTGTDVPTTTTVNLQGDGVYHLTRNSTSKTTADAADLQASKDALATTYIKDVYDELFTQFGTRRDDTMNANLETWKLMSSDSASFSSQGLVATRATGTYAVADTLETDVKIAEWADECLVDVTSYAVWRANRQKTYNDAIAAL